jgi:hypothetical protein
MRKHLYNPTGNLCDQVNSVGSHGLINKNTRLVISVLKGY